MEGMLSPEIKEEIVATVEVLETFKISKVGTIAGCVVREGKITRSSKVRVIPGWNRSLFRRIGIFKTLQR